MKVDIYPETFLHVLFNCEILKCLGKSAFSEVENRNVRDFIMERKGQIKFFNSLHSYSQYVRLKFAQRLYNSQSPHYQHRDLFMIKSIHTVRRILKIY